MDHYAENSNGAELPDAPAIDQIEILALLGSGGTSVVYKAKQLLLGRIVAVKVLTCMPQDSEIAIKRFRNEARLSSLLDHPNVAKILGYGVLQNEKPYLILEYVEGNSLADEFSKGSALSFGRFREIFLPILSALDAAHHAGIVHRDIKPGNIMLCKTFDGAESVKLLDFGIAKMLDSETPVDSGSLTKTGAVLGSPNYMSPEQCLSQPIDARSDIYSLSCVMYEALCAELPFKGDSAYEVMHQRVSGAPPSLAAMLKKSNLSESLASLILSGLEKNPQSRPQSAAEYAQKLSKALDAVTLDRAPGLKMPPRAKQSASMMTIVATVVFGIIVLLFVIANFKMAGKNKDGNPSLEYKSLGTIRMQANQLHSEGALRDELPLRLLLIERSKDKHLKTDPFLCFDFSTAAECAYYNASFVAGTAEGKNLCAKSIEFANKGLALNVGKLQSDDINRLYFSKIGSLLFLGEKAKALECLDSFYKALNKCPPPDKLNCLRDMGSNLLRMNLPEQAIANSEKLIAVAHEFPETSKQVGWEIFAKIQHAQALKAEHRNKESLQYCHEAMRLLLADRYVNGGHRAELIANLPQIVGENGAEFIPLIQEDLTVNAALYSVETDGSSLKKVHGYIEELKTAMAKGEHVSKSPDGASSK